jgi:hypothetical protein
VALPPTNPRFCIECGGSIRAEAAPPEAEYTIQPAPAPTVQLPNARVAQSVIGGTIRLPTSGAIPPGLWFADQPPGPDDVVAIYAPLRAIVGGWSGLAGMGWRAGAEPPLATGSRMIFSFTASREWFPSPGCGQGLRLQVQLVARAEAAEGHTRRGFRYRAQHDPPMEVAEARWLDARGEHVDRPLPQIQIMAPPRVKRVSDYDERIETMSEGDAASWAREGQLHGQFQLLYESQQRTPAGRGLPLAEIGASWFPLRLLSRPSSRYQVQIFHPLLCRWAEWPSLQARVEAEARGLGLDLATDLVVEWWLDREGYDGVLIDDAQPLYDRRRVVIAFRRSQIVKCSQV